MERSAWTDERLDDFAASVTGELRLLRTEMREEFRAMRTEMHEEFRAMRAEMHEEFRAMRAEMGSLQRQMTQIGWALVIALIGAVVTIVVALV
jgi:hypothetical protein